MGGFGSAVWEALNEMPSPPGSVSRRDPARRPARPLRHPRQAGAPARRGGLHRQGRRAAHRGRRRRPLARRGLGRVAGRGGTGGRAPPRGRGRGGRAAECRGRLRPERGARRVRAVRRAPGRGAGGGRRRPGGRRGRRARAGLPARRGARPRRRARGLLAARRRLGAGRPRRHRPRLPGARQRLGRRGPLGRLPPRARAPVPGGGAGRRRGRGLARTAPARELGVDPARVLVGGDSAGGNLAAVAALHRRDAVRGQLLVYPVVDGTTERPSWAEHAADPVLSARTCARCGGCTSPAPTRARPTRRRCWPTCAGRPRRSWPWPATTSCATRGSPTRGPWGRPACRQPARARRRAPRRPTLGRRVARARELVAELGGFVRRAAGDPTG